MRRYRHIAIMLLAAGAWGVSISILYDSRFILYLAVINIVLGIIFLLKRGRQR